MSNPPPHRSALPPIRRGTIVNAWSPGKRGRGLERYYLVISDAADHGLDRPLICLGISTQIPDPPPDHAVLLPFHPNPTMRPSTGLARRCGVVVDWGVAIDQDDVNNRKVGYVSAKLLEIILGKLAALRRKG